MAVKSFNYAARSLQQDVRGCREKAAGTKVETLNKRSEVANEHGCRYMGENVEACVNCLVIIHVLPNFHGRPVQPCLFSTKGTANVLHGDGCTRKEAALWRETESVHAGRNLRPPLWVIQLHPSKCLRDTWETFTEGRVNKELQQGGDRGSGSSVGRMRRWSTPSFWELFTPDQGQKTSSAGSKVASWSEWK